MELTVTIKMQANRIPGATRGFMTMKHADCLATISDDENEIAQIGGTIGAGYEINDKETGYTWHIGPEAFWEAYQEAIKTGQSEARLAL